MWEGGGRTSGCVDEGEDDEAEAEAEVEVRGEEETGEVEVGEVESAAAAARSTISDNIFFPFFFSFAVSATV